MQMNVPAPSRMHDDSGMTGFRKRILRQNGELVYRIVRFVTVYRTKYALTGPGITRPALLATSASPELKIRRSASQACNVQSRDAAGLCQDAALHPVLADVDNKYPQ